MLEVSNLLDLPDDVLAMIAEGSADACRLIWYHHESYRPQFVPYYVASTFIERKKEPSCTGTRVATKMFGRLQSIDDKPATSIGYSIEWWDRGERHRNSGPAYLDWHLMFTQWFQRGVTHRVGGGPAIVGVDDSECIWMFNGVKHRSHDSAGRHQDCLAKDCEFCAEIVDDPAAIATYLKEAYTILTGDHD